MRGGEIAENIPPRATGRKTETVTLIRGCSSGQIKSIFSRERDGILEEEWQE